MSNILGFDPKSMSDDELVSKANDLMGKMSWAQRFSTMGQGVEQMSMMLAQLEAERYERMFMANWKAIESYVSEPIETDPGLQRAARMAREKQQPERPNHRQRAARRPFPPRTAHPVLPAPSTPEKD